MCNGRRGEGPAYARPARRSVGRRMERTRTTKLAILAALPLAALAIPAFAGPDCGDMARAAPMWQAAKVFEEAGGMIRDMKLEDGCYEIKGEMAGRKVEVYYSPATAEELERNES